MKIYMTEEDVLNEIAGGDVNANDLLNEANPNFEKRFKTLTKGLENLMKDIRKSFPDANYYSANDGILLMLGDSHSASGSPQQDLVAADGGMDGILSGGDF
ncbi:hypothetical protein [Acinetobacter baumannii]|uniref:Uncharacterized protein n=1 Tax=Acinetobacter baumannii TaxID=470 RepID=A0A7X1VJ98_ACIBA|nr:hypothetical protein [Acinetobacter baumannii]ALJ86718.1 hypothetical protein AN415_00798 [Acinetobacter baumannii]EGJ59983.1 hypothetical protein HMPREF0021_02311 [Acinetobacter baumannii 6013150]EGJ63438.1 hypothetical protein HMPREF0020_03003 [Acinetobacter baumannii 6013113]EHU1797794.1 hypothetical protein [Acinetobacter baumannii]EHU2743577.1 hypothetical protein [Acinetobacter baumannii]